MIPIPPDITILYDAALMEKGVPVSTHFDYRKWLRNYLDFCLNHHHKPSKNESFAPFAIKLKDKNQNEQQRKQAFDAISIYYQIEKGTPDQGDAPLLENKNQQISTINTEANSTHADWSLVYTGLDSEIQLRHYSPKTLTAYSGWVRQLQGFTRSKAPQSLSSRDVKDFLTHLAIKRKVSASSQNQAFNAILFFFRYIIKKDFGEIKDIPRAKRRPCIPTVLSRDEVDAIIARLRYPYDLVVKLLYGCGLRISECVRLRVQDLNFDQKILTVHDGKGKKDRTVPLPETILPELKAQLEHIITLHQKDLEAGYAGTFLMGLLEKKYKNAAKELAWQWFFPGKTLTFIAESKEYRRYYLHHTHVQKAIKKAVNQANIPKRASAHTFRHSFASHLLLANYDIRTIQQLLGHSDVRTTMIYTHTDQNRTIKEAKSPLDFS